MGMGIVEDARAVAQELTAAAMVSGKVMVRLPGDYAVFPMDGPNVEACGPMLCKLKINPSGGRIPSDPRRVEPWYPLNLDFSEVDDDRWVPGELEAREFMKWEGEIRSALL